MNIRFKHILLPLVQIIYNSKTAFDKGGKWVEPQVQWQKKKKITLYISLAISLHIIYKEGINVWSVEKKQNDWKEKDIKHKI